jgi:hypothetical protein
MFVFGFGWKHNAGLLCVGVAGLSIHALVQREHWTWGWGSFWWDGMLYELGFGPLALFTYDSCWRYR